MVKKVYAVLKGRRPGIYHTWAQCQEQIHGFSGAQYKSFPTPAQAEEYMNGGSSSQAGGRGAKNRFPVLFYQPLS